VSRGRRISLAVYDEIAVATSVQPDAGFGQPIVGGGRATGQLHERVQAAVVGACPAGAPESHEEPCHLRHERRMDV
jgi:hypothetical protein